MNTYTHPAGNWRCFPDVRNVTLRPQLPLQTEIAGVKAKPRPLSGAELAWAASVGLSAETLNWILWTETLGGAKPQVLDEIVDTDGVVWIVQRRNEVTLGTRWRCTCSRKGA